MGVGLYNAALLVARDVGLPHAPARVFAHAAHCALDRDARPVYFGGRDRLALALGKPSSVGGFRAVEDAMSVLKHHGLIEVVVRGAPNRNARYALLDATGHALRPLDKTHGSGGGVEREANDNTHRSASKHPQVSVETPTAQVGAEGHRGQEGQGARFAHTRPTQSDRPDQDRRGVGAARNVPKGVGSNNAGTGVTAEQSSQESHPPSMATGKGREPVGDPWVCPRHPNGNPNDENCRGCGKVREQLELVGRKRRESSVYIQTVQPGSRCAPRPHKWARDRTCLNCDIRPSDLDHPDNQPDRAPAHRKESNEHVQ